MASRLTAQYDLDFRLGLDHLYYKITINTRSLSTYRPLLQPLWASLPAGGSKSTVLRPRRLR
jgi:hypothetical protein